MHPKVEDAFQPNRVPRSLPEGVVVPPDQRRRHHSRLLRAIPKPGVISLVFLQEALAQVEYGRGPQSDEDRRLTPARSVERKRDHNRDEGPSDVDSLATVHVVYLLECLLDVLYPVGDLGNRQRTVSLALGEGRTS